MCKINTPKNYKTSSGHLIENLNEWKNISCSQYNTLEILILLKLVYRANAINPNQNPSDFILHMEMQRKKNKPRKTLLEKE